VANYSAEVTPPASPEQARDLTARFHDLQGLRQVPISIWIVGLSVALFFLPMNRDQWGDRSAGKLILVLSVLLVTLAPAIVSIKLISNWYRRKFGAVEPTRVQRWMGGVLGGTGALAFLLPLNFEQSLWLFSNQSWPLNVALFTLALWIFGYWWYLGRWPAHYAVVAGAGVALGLLSLVGVPPATFPWHLREALLYIGTASIAVGVLDHMTLTRRLSRTRDLVGEET
jgi:hypothetical protein